MRITVNPLYFIKEGNTAGGRKHKSKGKKRTYEKRKEEWDLKWEERFEELARYHLTPSRKLALILSNTPSPTIAICIAGWLRPLARAY